MAFRIIAVHFRLPTLSHFSRLIDRIGLLFYCTVEFILRYSSQLTRYSHAINFYDAWCSACDRLQLRVCRSRGGSVLLITCCCCCGCCMLLRCDADVLPACMAAASVQPCSSSSSSIIGRPASQRAIQTTAWRRDGDDITTPGFFHLCVTQSPDPATYACVAVTGHV